MKKLSDATKELLTGLSYEQRYGNRAEEQKLIRSYATKKVWETRSLEERKQISKKALEKLKGRSPWNKGIGKFIEIDGISFNRLKEAATHYDTSVFLLKKNYVILYKDVL